MKIRAQNNGSIWTCFFLFFRQAVNLQRVHGGGEPEGSPAQRLRLSVFMSRSAQGELIMWKTGILFKISLYTGRSKHANKIDNNRYKTFMDSSFVRFVSIFQKTTKAFLTLTKRFYFFLHRRKAKDRKMTCCGFRLFFFCLTFYYLFGGGGWLLVFVIKYKIYFGLSKVQKTETFPEFL